MRQPMMTHRFGRAARATCGGALVAMLAVGCASPSPVRVPADQQPIAPATTTRPAYPAARVDETVDDYHGTKVADPYRWLEDASSPETKSYIDAQNVLVREFVDGSTRERVHARLTELLNYPRYSPPAKHGEYYTFTKNDGLQPHA